MFLCLSFLFGEENSHIMTIEKFGILIWGPKGCLISLQGFYDTVAHEIVLSGTLLFFGVWSGQQKQGCEDEEEAEAELSLLWGPVALGFGTGTDLFVPPVAAAIFIVDLLAAISNQYAPVFDNEATGGRPGVEAGVEESLACNRVGTVELVEGGALEAGDGGEGGGQHRHQNKKQQHFPLYFAWGSMLWLCVLFNSPLSWPGFQFWSGS